MCCKVIYPSDSTLHQLLYSILTGECIKIQKTETVVSGKVERDWGKVLETGNHCLIHHFMFSRLHAEKDTGGKSLRQIKQDYLFRKIKEASRCNPFIGSQINYFMDTACQQRHYNDRDWIS